MPGVNGAVAPDETVDIDDLQWWLDLAPRLEWTFAKTYADTAPHSYVVLGRTKGITREDFVRAGRVIRTFGQPGRFYSYTNIYLVSPDGSTKWWTMDEKVTDTDLINQASTDRVYGVQDAPSTRTDQVTLYDRLATAYDEMWTRPEDLAENEAVRRLVTSHFGAYAPTVLDIGAGTGLLLDMKVTHPALYVGVDPSQGMLNELVRKHPKVQRVVPKAVKDLRPGDLADGDERFDLVCALFSVASYLTADEVASLPRHLRPGGMLLLMTYADGYRPDYYAPGDPGPVTRDEALAACRALPLSRPEFTIGEFNCFVVTA